MIYSGGKRRQRRNIPCNPSWDYRGEFFFSLHGNGTELKPWARLPSLVRRRRAVRTTPPRAACAPSRRLAAECLGFALSRGKSSHGAHCSCFVWRWSCSVTSQLTKERAPAMEEVLKCIFFLHVMSFSVPRTSKTLEKERYFCHYYSKPSL